MPSEEKTILAIFAHNEEATVSRAVNDARELVRLGVIAGFVVVDDHSDDLTAKIAKNCGATVVGQQVLSGPSKSAAFLQAALYCKENGATMIMTLDADLAGHFTARHARRMLNELSGNPQIAMVVHPAVEADVPMDTEISGQRAIRMSALNFLFASKTSQDGTQLHSLSGGNAVLRIKGAGYCLEDMLNSQMGKKRTLFLASSDAIKFNCSMRWGRKNRQLDDLDGARALLISRRILKNEFQTIRRLKQYALR